MLANLSHTIASFDLVGSSVECLSNDTLLAANVSTPAGCARRCKSTPGCEFFVHGFGDKAGRCYQEYTANETCIEGWEVDHYDFYKLNDVSPSPELDTHFLYEYDQWTSASTDASFHRIKAGHECDDGANTKLRDVDTPQECADSCANYGNCTFFLYGFNTKRKQCWVEWTQSSDCPEGWEKDDFDFYMLLPAVPRAPPSSPSPPAPPPAPPPMPPPVYTGFIAGMLAGSGFMMAVTLLLMIPLLTILAKLLRSRQQKQPRPCPPPAHACGDAWITIAGFHNWIQFYFEERCNHLDYRGYILPKRRGRRPDEPPDGTEHFLSVQFEWEGETKPVSGMFVGVSPEFELALYTLLYYEGGDNNKLHLGDVDVNLRVYRLDRIGCISSAFPEAADSLDA